MYTYIHMNVQNMLLMFHMHSLVCSWIVQLVLGTALMLVYLCDNIGPVLVCLPSGSTDVTTAPSRYVRLFIVVLQELHCLPNCLHVFMIRVITSRSFIALHVLVSEIAKCIARGCLLLFYKNYIVYQIVYMFL